MEMGDKDGGAESEGQTGDWNCATEARGQAGRKEGRKEGKRQDPTIDLPAAPVVRSALRWVREIGIGSRSGIQTTFIAPRE